MMRADKFHAETGRHAGRICDSKIVILIRGDALPKQLETVLSYCGYTEIGLL